MSLDLEPLAVTTYIGAADASASPAPIVFVAPCNCQILGAYLTDSTTKSFHADNHGHYNLLKKGAAGTGTDIIAAASTVAADLTANVPKALTMSSTVSNQVAAGQALALSITESGTATSGDLVAASVTVLYMAGYGADVV